MRVACCLWFGVVGVMLFVVRCCELVCNVVSCSLLLVVCCLVVCLFCFVCRSLCDGCCLLCVVGCVVFRVLVVSVWRLVFVGWCSLVGVCCALIVVR